MSRVFAYASVLVLLALFVVISELPPGEALRKRPCWFSLALAFTAGAGLAWIAT